MKNWKYGLITSAMVLGSLALASPLAFASTTTGLTLSPGQTSVTLTVPNLDSQLQPAQTLSFTFTPENGSIAPITTTGTYIAGSPDVYNVPVPNFGQQETVNISTGFTYSGVNYTATAGPLIDTLPFAPLAAALPLGMLGVWYVMRKRRMLQQS